MENRRLRLPVPGRRPQAHALHFRIGTYLPTRLPISIVLLGMPIINPKSAQMRGHSVKGLFNYRDFIEILVRYIMAGGMLVT